MFVWIFTLSVSVCLVSCSSCDYKGTSYRSGATWVAEDKCNVCTCQGDGTYSCETKQCSPVTCHDNGVDHALGSTYSAADGCNECLCTINGAVCSTQSCWQFGAGTGHTQIPRCYYFGRVYVVGESFAARDECNRCICKDNQVELCSNMFCAPPTQTPPETQKPTEATTNAPATNAPTTNAPATNAPTTNAPTTTKATEMPTTLVMTTKQTTAILAVTTDAPTTQTTVPTCNYNGRIYNLGDSFKADDGCNTCQCRGDDNVMCTKKACPPTTTVQPTEVSSTEQATVTPAVRSTPQPTTQATEQTTKYHCNYNGQNYDYGSSFTAIDGCNVCICGQTQVLCSLRACATTAKPTSVATSSAPSVTNPTVKQAAKCSYNGKEYNEGDSFLAIDGCNRCRCTSDGSVACTKMLCETTPLPTPANPNGSSPTPAPVPNNTPATKCTYGGKDYAIGASFTAADGCNKCTCTGSGVAACTLMLCPPTTNAILTAAVTQSVTISTSPTQCLYNGNYYDIDAVFQDADGCNTCTCASNGAVGCTLMICPGPTVNHLKITLDK